MSPLTTPRPNKRQSGCVAHISSMGPEYSNSGDAKVVLLAPHQGLKEHFGVDVDHVRAGMREDVNDWGEAAVIDPLDQPPLTTLQSRIQLRLPRRPCSDGHDEVVPVLRRLPGSEVQVPAVHLRGEHGHGDHGRVVRRDTAVHEISFRQGRRAS
jgi:hypothetical protein